MFAKTKKPLAFEEKEGREFKMKPYIETTKGDLTEGIIVYKKNQETNKFEEYCKIPHKLNHGFTSEDLQEVADFCNF